MYKIMFIVKMYLNVPKIHKESKDRPWPRTPGPSHDKYYRHQPKKSNPFKPNLAILGARAKPSVRALWPKDPENAST